jgi:adenylyl-sulfate kinase
MSVDPIPRGSITRQQREAHNGHQGGVVFMTGLSGAGKSTLATLVEQQLYKRGTHCYVLDGDELRQGIGRDLGFSDADRVENVRRAVEIARLMADAGLVVIMALISPFRAGREAARARFAPGEFIEVFVDSPLTVCEARDPKGLYKRVRQGEIRGFTGIDSRYEVPLSPDVHLDSALTTPQQAAAELLAHIEALGLVPPLVQVDSALTQLAAAATGAAGSARCPGFTSA